MTNETKNDDEVDDAVETERAMMMVGMVYPVFLHVHPATSLTALEMLCARVLVLRGVDPAHFARQLANTHAVVKRNTAAAVELALADIRKGKP